VRTPGLTPEEYRGAVERLAAADPVLSGVVERWGPPPFWRHPEGFAGLVHGIPRDMDTATSYVYYTCKEGSCAAN